MPEVWRQLGRHCFFIEEDFLWSEWGRMFSHNRHCSILLTQLYTKRHSCCGVHLLAPTVLIFSVCFTCVLLAFKCFYVGGTRFVQVKVSAGEEGQSCICREQMMSAPLFSRTYALIWVFLVLLICFHLLVFFSFVVYLHLCALASAPPPTHTHCPSDVCFN